MKDMIGYSGLDCETCDAYIATVHDDLVLREKTAKLWAGLNNAPILPEHINCEGCRKHGAKTAFRSVDIRSEADFFKKCLKSSPRRGSYFPARQFFYPYKKRYCVC